MPHGLHFMGLKSFENHGDCFKGMVPLSNKGQASPRRMNVSAQGGGAVAGVRVRVRTSGLPLVAGQSVSMSIARGAPGCAGGVCASECEKMGWHASESGVGTRSTGQQVFASQSVSTSADGDGLGSAGGEHMGGCERPSRCMVASALGMVAEAQV